MQKRKLEVTTRPTYILDQPREGERRVRRMNLSEAKTCELVAELEKREGAEAHWAGPYKDLEVKVNGPAVVLVVID